MTNNLRNNALSTNSLFSSTLLGKDIYYRVQNVILPGLSVMNINTDMNMGMMVNFQGSTVDYNPLNLKIIVDTKLNVWKTFVRFFQNISTPNQGHNNNLEHISLLQLYDSKNNLMFKVEFYGCMFKSISDLDYDFTSNNEELTLELNLDYDYYKIIE